jgi:hypothetical protein
MGANLSNDEAESIFIVNTNHHSGIKIDSLTYNSGSPWPEGAAGLGYSMELIDPLSDNSNSANWKNSSNYVGMYNGHEIYASPGYANSTLGIDDEVLAKTLNLYPNPVTDLLHINSEIPLSKVEIYSILGKKVKEFKSGLYSVPMNNLSNGIYYVRILSDNGSTTRKLIKK